MGNVLPKTKIDTPHAVAILLLHLQKLKSTPELYYYYSLICLKCLFFVFLSLFFSILPQFSLIQQRRQSFMDTITLAHSHDHGMKHQQLTSTTLLRIKITNPTSGYFS